MVEHERRPITERRTTEGIIGAFFEVYNNLGYGFLEHVYSLALEQELLARGHTVSREVIIHIFYKDRCSPAVHKTPNAELPPSKRA
jgi:GxxExxY protein